MPDEGALTKVKAAHVQRRAALLASAETKTSFLIELREARQQGHTLAAIARELDLTTSRVVRLLSEAEARRAPA